MPNKQTHFRRFRALYVLALAAALILVAARVFFTPAGKDVDWPVWVQAVGSIAAVLVAVWVSADQLSQQQLREQEQNEIELEGVLRSLCAEVNTTIRYIAIEVVAPLAELKPGHPLRRTFPLPENPFPIFDALIPKLAVIPSDRLQRQIIHTFALAKSFTMVIKHHNKLFDELKEEEALSRELPDATAWHQVRRAGIRLTNYSDGLRGALSDVRNDLIALEATLLNMYPET